MATKKTKNLSSIKDELNKLRSGSMKTMDETVEIERIPTGVLAVDDVLQGGLPRGKITEVIGAHGSGKSALCTYLAAQAQEFGEVVYIDLENAVDRDKFEGAGVDLSRIMIAQPGSSEDTLRTVQMCVEANDVSCVIVDSVAAMTPLAEINGDFGDAIMGVQAKLMSQGMRKLNDTMIELSSNVMLVFINQYRKRMQTVGNQNPNIPTGGEALTYYASTRIEVTRMGNLSRKVDGVDDVYGQDVKFKVLKNRYAPPFKTGKFEIHYDSGISNESWLLDACLSEGVIKQSGAWYANAITGESIGQGRLGVRDKLRENRELYDQLLGEIS
jgi:recombination protein RecA